MNSNSSYLPRIWLLLGSLAAGSVVWGATALVDNSHPKVDVKIDSTPISSIAVPGAYASFAPVVKRVEPSVVRILVTQRAKNVPAQDMSPFFNNPAFRQFFGNQFGNGNGFGFGGPGTMRQPEQQGLGSGVIVSADGYILTNNHVVHDADTIEVTLHNGDKLTAKVIGTDPKADLAVIKIEAHNLPAITFADSDNIEVGDRVLAIGNPYDVGETVTSGMVSGLGRANPVLGLDYEDFIQTDAAINPGNSGGALVDVDGRLVGINTAIFSRSGGFQGIGFAIPSNLAHNIMEQLAQNGKVVRGYLGVSVQDLTADLAAQFNLDQHSGALIADVLPNGPAARAGLKTGDVVTGLDGKPVTDARHLKLEVATLAPGTKVALAVLRDGHSQNLTINISEQPKDRSLASNDGSEQASPAEDHGTLNGVGVADLDRDTRDQLGVPAGIHGAVVTQVDPASPSAAAGLQPGDVIEEINHQPVHSADEATKLTENPSSKKTLVRVWNKQGTRYVVVDESATPAAS
jgi:Do/DeqQ family serine protease